MVLIEMLVTMAAGLWTLVIHILGPFCSECPRQVRNQPGSCPLCSYPLSPKTSCLAPSLGESTTCISFGSVAKYTSYLVQSSASSNHHGQAE